ncbi:MAG: ectoine hydroxylase-related dioxygenase (phytanoyl-CoA dioxygenase family) [Candidatus Azotimanducaceae bacterium]|jgi:ectoine hydroxylase-related dioxygenase (phytanoyl-CoA dioxygenase family)
MSKKISENMANSSPQDIDENLAAIHDVGYAVLEDLIDVKTIDAIKAELAPYLQKSLMGRNNFEGFESERVYALLAKAPSIANLVEHPTIIELLDKLLEPTYLLSANLAINVHPGETPQPYHADHASLPASDRTQTNGISVIWALDDFTADNGATEIIAGSHHWQTEQPSKTSEPIKVIMSAGSAVIFHGSLYHRGSANQSTASRLAITPQYCQPWLRQLENMVLAVPPAKAAQYSNRIQELLGYSIREPGFMGYVDGVHPKRLIRDDYQGRHTRGLRS